MFQIGELDRARPVLEAYYRQKQDDFTGLFQLADAYLIAGEDEKSVAVLQMVKDWLFALRRESDFTREADRLAAAYPASLPLAEFWASLYEDLNREAKYFDALIPLFDLYLEAGRIPDACNALDKLVDIDPYDARNHDRIAKLEGRVDPGYWNRIRSRVAQSAATMNRSQGLREEEADAQPSAPGPAEPVNETSRARQALEDLMIQVEIFLQYSLRPKAHERLQRIAEMFPGEEDTNERLRTLYERADWWPKGSSLSSSRAAVPVEASAASGYSAETHRDLAAIAEITRLIYRQTTPREILAAAVKGAGEYLNVARCFAAVGSQGAGQISAAFARPGLSPTPATALVDAVEQVTKSAPDARGTVELHPAGTPALTAAGLTTALGVQLIDKESETPAGVLLVGDTASRTWQQNESFFLQAVGDQLVISVNHARLRTLVRTLAVADERTGLLSRGAYLDCLLAETSRAREQDTPLALLILQMDDGHELLRQHGETALERHLEEIARHLGSQVRQSDLAVKYTAWSLAFVLPNTTLEHAGELAKKLQGAAAQVKSSWATAPVTWSAVVAEALGQPGVDKEDIVTEWINRAEFGLDKMSQRGGNTILPLAAPA